MTVGKIVTIIPTLDEALHVKRCVESALVLGSVFVIDCGSSDSTVDLARAAGAEVIQTHWRGHAAQKNWALDTVAQTAEYVLLLDADEYVSPELAAEILEAVDRGSADAWRVARRYIFYGRELRHAWWYPDYQIRFLRRGAARYEERSVHEHMVVQGITGTLTHALIHENLKGMSAFLERHMRYARLEAAEIAAGRVEAASTEVRTWRRLVKQRIWYRLKARPIIRFLWLYLFRRGFLDGREGLVFCSLIAAYDAMIEGYVLEQDRAS